jgi:hypothetical protein
MRRRGEPADGFSGDHQMRASGDSRQASDAWTDECAKWTKRTIKQPSVVALYIF